MIVGKEADLQDFIKKVGRPSTDSFIESDSDINKKNIFVTKPSAVHKNFLI